MNPWTTIAGITLLASTCGFAAGEDKSVSPNDSAETRKHSIASLETHIAKREQRLAELGRDIVELDTRIEKRIDDLVTMIAGLPETKDQDSATDQLRKEAVEALKRGLAAYSSKRKEVGENIRGGATGAEADLGKFDERIDKRVAQIAELTKSVPTQLNHEAPDYEGASYWNGFFFETNRLMAEGRKTTPTNTQTADAREKAAKTIRDGLDNIEKRRASLHSLLAKAKATESAKQLYTRELGKLDANANHLREQLRYVTLAATTADQPVSLDPVHDLGQILSDARGDLREDTARLFRTYDQYDKGRTYLEQLKTELAARKKWLDANAR